MSAAAVLSARTQRGIIAIEVALLCTMLVVVALFALVFGRFILQYNVMRAATGQAARYLSVAPVTQARRDFATQLVADAAADAGLSSVQVTINCPPLGDCPANEVQVITSGTFKDPTMRWFDEDGWLIKAVAVEAYYQDFNK